MTDIYLCPFDSPPTNIKLFDPTVQSCGGPVALDFIPGLFEHIHDEDSHDHDLDFISYLPVDEAPVIEITRPPEGAWWPWGVGWKEPKKPKQPKKLLKKLAQETIELKRIETIIPSARIKLAFTMLASLRLAEDELTIKEQAKTESLRKELFALYYRTDDYQRQLEDERLRKLRADDDEWMMWL